MTFELLIAIVLTASAALAIGTLAASLPARMSMRVGFAAALAAWFFAVAALAASGILAPERLGTRGMGLAVALPFAAVLILAVRWHRFRDAVLGIPLAVLIGINAVRVLGVFFVMLHADGRLPAPFAPAAGWGDILVGVTALPVAYLAARRASFWRPLALSWNLVGLADLVMAVGLGIASAADSPFPIATRGPDTTLMAMLPMFLIPGFLVPLLMLTHVAVFVRLFRTYSVRAEAAPA